MHATLLHTDDNRTRDDMVKHYEARIDALKQKVAVLEAKLGERRPDWRDYAEWKAEAVR